ncbi:MAG: hypothetical protein IJZ09_05275 [Tidjanibacter sp.]|nr:hypothetical protein [Tidjanibacter sp.]
MRFIKSAILRSVLMVVVATLLPSMLFAQQQGDNPVEEKSKARRKKKEVVAIADFTQSFSVRGGEKIMPVVRTPEQDSLEVVELSRLIDSLVVARESLLPEDTTTLANATLRIDSLIARRTTLLPADTVVERLDTIATDTIKKARYNWFFRDSLSLTPTTLASVILPGFAQFYEEKYWKIPLEYAMVGLPLWAGLEQNKKYLSYKAEFDKLAASGASQEERTPIQTKMLKHQNYRTLLIGAAAASFMGFLVDGVVNFPSDMSDIQKASTLSFVCPGAGQIYNGSYWKVPIVVVGMASMAYVIDWNQRGYNRFKLAYDLATDGDDSTISEFPYTPEESLRSIKNSYRRNRDLAIIGTVAVYLVQVADAHIDAHMQAYDISDNLSMKIEPQITQTVSPQGVTNNFGFNLTMNF